MYWISSLEQFYLSFRIETLKIGIGKWGKCNCSSTKRDISIIEAADENEEEEPAVLCMHSKPKRRFGFQMCQTQLPLPSSCRCSIVVTILGELLLGCLLLLSYKGSFWSVPNWISYTAGTAVSMCVTLQRAAREVSGKCYQNIANIANPVDASRESCRQRANFDCMPSA